MDPAFDVGYASHQVRSVDSVILIVIGIVFFFWGRHRYKRKTLSTREEHASHD
ncbi:MAG: hypothetical protein ABJA02_05695 [Acidobacteriota bacterium]